MPSSSAATDVLDHPLRGVVGAGTAEDPRLIVEIWLVLPTDETSSGQGGWRLLMCRRVEARGGFWQGVSGRVEPDDATLRAAALREIEEELCISHVEDLFDLGRWYEFESMMSNNVYRKRCIAAVLPRGTSAESVTLCDEHDDVQLMTFDEARAVAKFPEYVTELDALEKRLGDL